MYEYSAQLVKLVDGDTMHVEVDLGLDISTKLTIRLAGINAPEMSTPEGRTSKEWVASWLEANAPDGKFTLTTLKDHREKYGRYLGLVIANQQTLNLAMVEAGQAVVY